jgi:WD40 repeat protein
MTQLQQMRLAHEARDSQKWITDIKYSPNGVNIALGSADTKIYVYNIAKGYTVSAVISQHAAIITHLDFSMDSMWLRGNCGAYELKCFEADTGLYIPSASRLRDTKWSTLTCPLAWGTQGSFTCKGASI